MTSNYQVLLNGYQCSYGQDCDFIKSVTPNGEKCGNCENIDRPANNKLNRLFSNVVCSGLVGGVGALVDYCVVKADPIGGALFSLTRPFLDRGFRYIVNKSPFKDLGDEILPYAARNLAITGASAFVAASALNKLGHPVSGPALFINLAPIVSLVALQVGVLTLVKAKIAVAHRQYHEHNGSCPAKAPVIEQAEKCPNDNKETISEDTKLVVQE